MRLSANASSSVGSRAPESNLQLAAEVHRLQTQTAEQSRQIALLRAQNILQSGLLAQQSGLLQHRGSQVDSLQVKSDQQTSLLERMKQKLEALYALAADQSKR